MPPDVKCVYWNRSENLSGKPILLTIRQYHDKTIEVLVRYAKEDNLYRKVISIYYCIAIFVVVLCIVYNTAFTVNQERVLVVESLGYQIEVHYALGQTMRYIAWQHIKAVFINEVVSKQRVIFILAMLTKDTAKEASTIVPLFSETMPRLSCLEAIYRCIENCHK